MAEIDAVTTRFTQPLLCKCGRPLTALDVIAIDERIEIVCSGCHAGVLEIECEIRGDHW